jgi:enoyl-CoA hydratase/carnithine racemase
MDGAQALVRTELSGPVLLVRLSRPEKLNALGRPLLSQLCTALENAAGESSIRVVLLSGEGRVFSAGADLAEFAGLDGPATAAGIRERAELARRAATLLETMDPITVAAVHGRVVGGALVLMLACDFRMAAPDTVFHLPEAEMGNPLGWGGVPRLVREIGPARTMDLIVTARAITSDEALDAGLITRIAGATVDADSLDLAQSIAGRSRMVRRTTKRHVRAITNAIADPARSFADDDTLALGVFDPEVSGLRAKHTSSVVRAVDGRSPSGAPTRD